MTDTTLNLDQPLPGMPPAPLAACPERVEDVTAGSLARWLSVHLTQRGALHFTGLHKQNPAAHSHSLDALVAEWALCHILRELPADVGDRLAKAIWTAWDEGSALYELPPEWMRSYGMDPEPVIQKMQAATKWHRGCEMTVRYRQPGPQVVPQPMGHKRVTEPEREPA